MAAHELVGGARTLQRWFCCPDMRHLYQDNVWKEIGQAIGRYTYLPDVYIEHLHHSSGKSPFDPTYAHVDDVSQGDAEAFTLWLATGFGDVVDRVQAVLS